VPISRARAPYYEAGPARQQHRPGLPDDVARPDEWRTPPLWGVADSAPYLHDGRAATSKTPLPSTAAKPPAPRNTFKAYRPPTARRWWISFARCAAP